MVSVTALLVALGLAASVVPGLQDRSEAAAERFRDRATYAEFVLHSRAPDPPRALPAVLHHGKPASLLYGTGAGALTAGVVLFGLYRRRLPGDLRRVAARVLDRPVAVLKALHSGVASDYVVWLTVGTALFGGIWALTLR